MDRVALEALAKRVEAAEGPDREIDAAIAAALVGATMEWQVYRNDWSFHRDGRWVSVGGIKPVTASLDAVRTLIGYDEWDLSTQYCIARATVGIERDHQTSWPGHGEHAGNDPVLALLAAALRALALRAAASLAREPGEGRSAWVIANLTCGAWSKSSANGIAKTVA